MTGGVSAPSSEAQLLRRAQAIAGMSLAELGERLDRPVPDDPRRAKGFAGQLIEAALGASAGSLPEPDFQRIGVELKTLPVGAGGRPLESTFVCTLPLEYERAPRWEDSFVHHKLARVLWVPVQGERGIPVSRRRVGGAVLWSPSAAESARLRADWEEVMELVLTGRVAEITAHRGACLQVRPKAADSSSRRWGVDADGVRVRTLPRGFYLRASFTGAILRAHYADLRA